MESPRLFELTTFFWNYVNGVLAITDKHSLKAIERRSRIASVLYETANQKAYAKFMDDQGPRTMSLSQSDPRRDLYMEVLLGLKQIRPTIFTFVPNEIYRDQPWFTGDLDLYVRLNEYLDNNGAKFEKNDFAVPFTNGAIFGGNHGHQARELELSFVTTPRDFLDVFWKSIEHILAMPRPRLPEICGEPAGEYRGQWLEILNDLKGYK